MKPLTVVDVLITTIVNVLNLCKTLLITFLEIKIQFIDTIYFHIINIIRQNIAIYL